MKGSSRRTSRTKRIIPLLIVGGAAIAAWYLIPRIVLGVVAVVVFPISAFNTWLSDSTASLPQYLRDRNALVEELRTLENELVAEQGDEFTYAALERENEELRALLGDQSESRIVAGVIGRPNRLPYDVLLLDRGARDGVVTGAPVYSGERTVIGYVSTLTERQSVVTLITSPQFQSTVFILGPDIYTTAEGIGGGQLRIGVPQGIPLTEGDLVVIPAVSSGVYGTVHFIESTPTQPEQYAYVAPETPLVSLRLVAVGTVPLTSTDFQTAEENVAAANTELFSVPVPEGVLVVTQPTSTPGTALSTSTAETTSVGTSTVQ